MFFASLLFFISLNFIATRKQVDDISSEEILGVFVFN